MFSAISCVADERREEGTSVRQPSGHPDEIGGGDSGYERACDGGPQRGRSLSPEDFTRMPRKTFKATVLVLFFCFF